MPFQKSAKGSDVSSGWQVLFLRFSGDFGRLWSITVQAAFLRSSPKRQRPDCPQLSAWPGPEARFEFVSDFGFRILSFGFGPHDSFALIFTDHILDRGLDFGRKITISPWYFS
jgi:hypothetical protein